MLPRGFRETLLDTVSNALERMAFMVGEPAIALNEEYDFVSYVSVIVEDNRFDVVVRATDGAVHELLSGLIDAESCGDEEAQLAVDELANVFGGEVLRILGGDVRPSALGLPVGHADVVETDSTVRAALDFLGEAIEVAVTPQGVPA